jgi:hypothetical protein
MLKLRAEVREFAEEMEKILRKHDHAKADSWKSELTIEELADRLEVQYDGWIHADNEDNDQQRCIDMANYCMMLYHRIKMGVAADVA